MPTPVVFNGANYLVPAYAEQGWAQGSGNLSSYLVAIAAGTLQTTGGNFTLSAPVNFGATYGITAASFTVYGSSAQLSAYYSQTFTNQASVTVTHNLGHYPLVQVLDSGGNVLDPNTLTHGSVNAFTVTFIPNLTGTIIYVG